MYGSFGLLIFLFLLASSSYGRIQIKLANKPEYSIFSWGSMLFAAGIGAVSLSTLGTNVPLTSVTGRARGHYDYVFFKIGSTSTSSSSSSSLK